MICRLSAWATSGRIVHGFLRIATRSVEGFVWALRLVQVGERIVVRIGVGGRRRALDGGPLQASRSPSLAPGARRRLGDGRALTCYLG